MSSGFISFKGSKIPITGPEGVPFKPMTLVEYEGLSEEEKAADIYYEIIDDPPKYLNDSYEIAPNIYSTEEQVVGQWIDGKPIYRKIIKGTTPSAFNTVSYVPIGASIDFMISFDGFLKRGNSLSTNTFDVMDSMFMITIIDNNQIRMMVTNESNPTHLLNKPFTAIVKYTKTTDLPTLGTFSIFPVGVDDYDDPTGWHVRKYSDGYAELTYFGDDTLASWSKPNYSLLYIVTLGSGVVPKLPFDLTKTYSIESDVLSAFPNESSLTVIPTSTQTGTMKTFCWTNQDEPWPCKISIRITGRWKEAD